MENNINIEPIKDLCAGATVSQKAKLCQSHNIIDYKTSAELSYADILNITLACNIISEFYDVCATVLVKNNTLSGAALGASIFDSFQKAIDCNPMDSVCGAVAVTKTVELDLVRLLTREHIIIAPDFQPEAENYLDANKIKYVKLNTPLNEYKNYLSEEIIVTPFGTVIHELNKKELDKDSFKVVSEKKPTVEQIEDAIFAWKITKYIRSSGVVVVKNFKTLGISQGIQNPAFEYALNCACDNAKESVLATDIPLNDYDLNVAIQNRVSLIIQPGVTEAVLKKADKFEIAMITTGISNFSIN